MALLQPSLLIFLLVWISILYTVEAHPQGMSTTSSPSVSAEPSPAFSPKILFGKNYAMVCMDSKGFTDYCQKWGGYYCDSSGGIDTTMPDNDEEVFWENYCECVNLFPKPNRCILGISGAVYCSRDLPAAVNVDEFSSTGLEETIKSKINRRSEEVFPDTEYDNALESEDTWNNFKCLLGISGNAYRMRSIDKVDPDTASVEIRSEELDLFVDDGNDTPNCLRTRDGQVPCLSSGFAWYKIEEPAEDMDCSSGTAALFVGSDSLVSSTASEPEAATGSLSAKDVDESSWSPFKQGEYAMVCADDREKTFKRLSAGYHCDYRGKLTRTSKGHDWSCEGDGNCICVDLFPKPICAYYVGSYMCARDFDETERLPSTTDLAALQSSGLSMRASQGWGTVNDYALNCFDSSQATKVCLMKGHYRDGSGKLVFKAQGIVDRACDKEWCQCINLNPTPKCFLAAAGVLKCKRSDGQLVDTDVGSITASEHDGEELIQERDTGLDMVQPSQEAAVPSAKASALAQRSTEGLVKRHDYAMVCYESSVRTAICSRAGYYCDSRGRLRHNKNFDVNPDCSNDSLCPCVNLFPQPRCVWFTSGLVCARDSEIPQIDPPPPPPPVSLAERSDKHLHKRHDYATSCLDSSAYTKICADAGYYCDEVGRLTYKGQGKGVKGCYMEDECRCVNFVPAPKCYVAFAGAYACVVRRADQSIDKVFHFNATDRDTARSKQTGHSLNPAARQLGNNDWAMNCLDIKESTFHCGKKGYYCNSIGKFLHKGGPADWVCEDGTCWCVNLNSKPKCVFLKSNQISCGSNPHSRALETMLMEGEGTEIEVEDDDEAYQALLREEAELSNQAS